MKFTAIAIYLTALTIGWAFVSVPAQRTPAANENYGVANPQIMATAERWLAYLPANEARATSDYIRRMANIHAGANESIEIANKEKMLSPCFSDLAKKFYLWLLEVDVKTLGRAISSLDQDIMQGRPNLGTHAGIHPYEDFRPGALWTKLMALTKGDANLAFNLLGLCGHDDAINDTPPFPVGTADQPFLTARKRLLSEMLNIVSPRAGDNSRPNILNEMTSAYRDLIATPVPTFRCLPWSVIYVPGALGKTLDLDASLKTEIARAQSPKGGAAQLPAKFYHVNASATISCDYKAASPIGWISLILNPSFGTIYRGVGLANKLTGEPINFRDHAPEDIRSDVITRMTTELLGLPRCAISARTHDYSARVTAQTRADDISYCTKARRAFEARSENWPLTFFNRCFELDRLLKRSNAYDCVLRGWAKVDAVELAKEWYDHYELPGVGKVSLPNVGNRIEHTWGRANAIEEGTSLVDIHGGPPRCGRPRWTNERCDRALLTLDSWDVDVRWTQSQHFMGAKFALQRCRTLEPGVSLNDLACRALRP